MIKKHELKIWNELLEFSKNQSNDLPMIRYFLEQLEYIITRLAVALEKIDQYENHEDEPIEIPIKKKMKFKLK